MRYAVGLRTSLTMQFGTNHTNTLGDEMNRDQPKSLSFPTNSARSKLAKGSSRVRRPELIRFSPKGFVHPSLDLENYVLRLLYCRKLRILQKGEARLVDHQREVVLTTRERWLHQRERLG